MSPGLLASRKRAAEASVLTAIAIALLTLWPFDGGSAPRIVSCPFCGWRAVADTFLNILLFVPLGACLMLTFRKPATTILTGGLFSFAIEAVQIVIPGRDPSLNDLVNNTLGAGLGIVVAQEGPRWLAYIRARGVSTAAFCSFVAIGLLALGSFLLGPSISEGPYTVEWTPGSAGGSPGLKVLDARIGQQQLPPGKVTGASALRPKLQGGMPIYVHLIPGPRTPGLVPILRIVDGTGDEVILLGRSGNSAVFRYRTRAANVGLREPDVRFRGFQTARTDETIRLVTWRSGRRNCITVRHSQSCRLGFTLGRTWALLFYPDPLPGVARRMFDLLWLGLLFLPTGLAVRERANLPILGVFILFGLAVPPLLTGMRLTLPLEYGAALSGLAGGFALRRSMRRSAAG